MRRSKRLMRGWFQHPVYTMFHPADGFYDMRHAGLGSVSQAAVLMTLFWLSFSINKQYAGFAVNRLYPLALNLFGDLAGVLLVYLLLCASNWSVAALMDGEGRFCDIAIAMAYALLPLIFALVPATVFSRFITQDEAAFYSIILGGAMAWSAALMFMGLLKVHNYTAGKTFVTLFLTVAAAMIIVFIAMLVVSLIQQLWVFAGSVYRELLYR